MRLGLFAVAHWTDIPAGSSMRTVPDAASHKQDDTGSNPTVALMQTSLFKGEILENFLEKTAI